MTSDASSVGGDVEQTRLPMGEFVPMMALVVSLGALSIDAMLPALSAIAVDLNATRPQDAQFVVSAMFLGFAVGQFVYGPYSDAKGRKPALYLGIGLFLVGCVLSLSAWSFSMMLAGRVLQGLGAASSRIVSTALVRDQYEGAAMARVMSLIMAVFILVPAVAPALGLGVMLVSHWRVIFGLLIVQALAGVLWLGLRQSETVPRAQQRALSMSRLWKDIKEVCRHRATVGYTVTVGLVFGNFVGYLTSGPQIFAEIFGIVESFPLYFAATALAIGAASVANSRLVTRWGMRRLTLHAVGGQIVLSLCFLLVSWRHGGTPPLAVFMVFTVALFFCLGILMGNLNSLAMQPVGHVAGTAAALSGSAATFVSLPIGSLVGQSYGGTIFPLVFGFVLTGIAASASVVWAGAGRVRRAEA